MTESNGNGNNKVCPRCGAHFVCRHDTPALCQCAGISLNDAARAYLRMHYDDCLCRKCLTEIAEQTCIPS